MVDRITQKMVSHRAWVFRALVFVGITAGFRIDGRFSTEFMFCSVCCVLFVISISFYMLFCLNWVKPKRMLPSSLRQS